ncbi:hypothetical protein CC86DRAFT_60725 [Ophiobolus disseminans]|uniref:Uncharacterized protein n=1 Tax=Ophiobolus disseminans TaxID=1469910 RepID=A0A6A6ZSR0_9PLEO|nr:hypothetical protein CC86DRAFT_60725 [Ophiobolus disseminans]
MQPVSNDTKEQDDGERKDFKLGVHDCVTSTNLKINSLFLLNVLKAIVGYVVGVADGEDYGLGPGLCHYPYREFLFAGAKPVRA